MKYFLLFFLLFSNTVYSFDSVDAVILAAGKSSRFKAVQSKLLTPFCGKEMILYPIDAVEKNAITPLLVLHHQKDAILSLLEEKKITFDYVEQPETLGTAHAVNIARKKLTKEHVLILNGDGPMVDDHLVKMLLEKHLSDNATITFVTAINSDPELSVARVVKADCGKIEIIEDKAFTGDRTKPALINAGIYVMKRAFIESFIDTIEPYAWGEVGIPELIKIATEKNEPVSLFEAPLDKVLSINTLKELATCEKAKREMLTSFWMSRGVRFINPETIIIDSTVTIGANTTICAGVHLLGKTEVGSTCRIGAYSILDSASIQDNETIAPYTFREN